MRSTQELMRSIYWETHRVGQIKLTVNLPQHPEIKQVITKITAKNICFRAINFIAKLTSLHNRDYYNKNNKPKISFNCLGRFQFAWNKAVLESIKHVYSWSSFVELDFSISFNLS